MSRASPTTAGLRSLQGALLEDARGFSTPLTGNNGRQTPLPAATAARLAQADLQGALAGRESELALARQQLAQLTADFKFNLKLLEERDLELERLEGVLGGLREAAAAKELALAEAQRLLAERDTALRERESRVAVLEERQRQTADLCERQVADARAARDEEVARAEERSEALERQLMERMASVESVAAREKADIIAGYERQIMAATSAEREARSAAQQARQDGELARSQLVRAEARLGEQELAMQRMATQFENALATLRQLEGQYSALSAESAAAEKARSARIQQLEGEVDALRAAQAAAQQEQEAAVAGLSQQLAERERQLSEAKQRYHRTSLDNADLTDTIQRLKQELQQARYTTQEAEGQLQSARDRCSQAQSALDRECSAHAQTQGLLETARLHLESTRREGEAQAQEVVQLKEAVAVLEAQCLDATQALETANAKLRSADERIQLLGRQIEQERAHHAEALDTQEQHLAAQAERALAAVEEDRARLQQALDQASRQLQQAYRETETLRLQLDHARLALPPPAVAASMPPPPPAAATAAAQPPRYTASRSLRTSVNSGLGLPGGRLQRELSPRRGDSTGSGGQGAAAAVAGSRQWQLGVGRYPAAQQGASEGVASTDSGDVFSDLADGGIDSGSRGMGLREEQQQATARLAAQHAQQAPAGPRPSRHRQQQLHQHIDALSTKLDSFEQAAELARRAGTQVVKSAEGLPRSLQLRQAEVAEGALKQKLARERGSFQQERACLAEQLAEKERLLQEREEELQALQREREAAALRQRQAELQRKEEELRELGEHLQQQQRWQQQQQEQQQGAVSAPPSVAAPPSPAAQRRQQLPHAAAYLPASAPASVTGTAPSSPAVRPLQPPDSRGAFQPRPLSQASAGAPAAQPAGAPPTGSAFLQQLRASAPAGAAGLRQSGASLRASTTSLAGVAPAAPAASAASLRGSLLAGAAGAGAAWGVHPAPPRQPGLEPLCTPRCGLAGGYASTQPSAAGVGLLRPRGGGPSLQPSLAGVGPVMPGIGPVAVTAGRLGALAAAAAVADGDDPLAKARRQVMLAKEYLRSVAEMGGRISRGD